ncbi:hypothetical protein F5X68DRAFT_231198 [Plectosphaerella plurivora]|uniref:F-box domain-containing protein n=1 Tax=Plectosphaerella plurivora TaxID=936078 RepID=A0A9P8VF54_9PEZI|nr:hypothetical protein F5X68DRAFT_231198 [Plectosphaerella plurivora]
MAHSIFSSPDVLLLIADQMNGRRALRSLVLVNRLFNDIFSPELWKTMDIRNFDTWPHDILDRDHSPLSSSNLAHVRSIIVNLPTKLELPNIHDMDEKKGICV